jgi:hypothetical protein
MKKTTLLYSLTALSLLTALTGMHAASVFSSDLSTLPAGLEVADTDGFGSDGTTDNSVTFSASGATFSSAAGNDARNYIRTTDTDYDSGDFVADVTWDGLGTAFIGFGAGNVGTFGTPDWDVADSLWMEISGTTTSSVQGMNPGRFSADLGQFDNSVVGGNASAPVRFRMIYLSGPNTLQFFADNDYNGTFSVDAQTVALSLESLGAGPDFITGPGDEARFYFGGGAPTFSDFQVSAVPEPSSFALIGGCLALGFVMMRRRQS